ncbi:MAG: small, acid-soluble spore protein, alpha/beta type [Bacillota bacterium]
MPKDPARQVTAGVRAESARAVSGKPQPAREKVKKEKPLTPEDVMKLDIARELGLYDKVQAGGWGDLTAAETGRIGGLLTKRRAKGGAPELEQAGSPEQTAAKE